MRERWDKEKDLLLEKKDKLQELCKEVQDKISAKR
jgi:hypothetical protein